jgi:hypothetical protein
LFSLKILSCENTEIKPLFLFKLFAYVIYAISSFIAR